MITKTRSMKVAASIMALAVGIGCGDDDVAPVDGGTRADAATDAGGMDGGRPDGGGGDEDGGAEDGGGAEDAGDPDAGPVILETVVVTVVGGPPAGHEVLLLDGSARRATTDATGTVTFTDVPIPYGLAATTFATESPPAVLEYRGLTRPDPTMVASTGFVTVGLARTAGSATLVTPSGVSVPMVGRQNIVGATAVNTVVATDDAGNWSNRSLHWSGSAPLTTKLYGFYFHPGPTPTYISAGLTEEATFVNGMMYSGLAIDVDTAVPQEDHRITIDFGSLPAATPAEVALWALSFEGERIGLGSAFGRNLLHSVAGHTGAPVEVDTTAVTAGTTWSVQFGDPFEPAVHIVMPAAAGGTTAVAVDATRFVSSFEPATRPADLTTVPVLRWAAVAGANALEITLTGDGLAYTAYRAVIPADHTELDLNTLWELAGPLSASRDYTWSVRAIYLPGFDADADADGTGRLLTAGGGGRLGSEDAFEIYRTTADWSR
jgi:hypothetical protein